ncbi:MAG TPA: MBL fold metallo-hydrolase [Solirubrobacterales bacterium]
MRTNSDEDRVTYVGHATVLLELDGLRFLTDPVLRSRLLHLRRQVPAHDRESTADLDAVLISHLHHDHVDVPSLRGLGRETRVLAPPGAGNFLRRRGFVAVTEMAPGESQTIDGVEVTAVEAEHAGGRAWRSVGSEAIGFVLSGTRRAYFAGDTDLFDGMSDLAGDLDLALLPVWGWGPTLGPGHLDPERAAEAAAALKPRIAVPIHWGTLFPVGLSRIGRRHLIAPPREFERRCAELAPQVEVRVLDPGEATSLSA